MRVVGGDVFDVAVDLRRSSPNFGKWVGEIFSADNKHQLWVPPGFGHGFLILIKTAMFVYKRVDYYAPEFERSVRRNDPEIGIDWPLEKDEQPVLSPKDREAPLLRDADTYQ
jgi:dTDP-4-dehydrorhamnose 3,5-epimerase